MYLEHNWKICGDFKILSMILGQQSGFIKHLCFLYLWDSRNWKNHYVQTQCIAERSVREIHFTDHLKIKECVSADDHKTLFGH